MKGFLNYSCLITVLIAVLLFWEVKDVLATTSSPSRSPTAFTSAPTTKSPTRQPTRAPTTRNPTSDKCPDDPTDSDKDGIPNCNDKCPNDFNKVVPGFCGCGVSDTLVDNNRDGYPECPDGSLPSQYGAGFGNASKAFLSNVVVLAMLLVGRIVFA
jgi:hypothetical protein